MKYDVLDGYRRYLSERYRPQTVHSYFKKFRALLEGQSILSELETLEMPKILANLSKCTYKNHFSQSKNALLCFLDFKNMSLSMEEEQQIEAMEKRTRKKYRKHREIDIDKIIKSIEHIQNGKLQLCYKAMLYTGLRVSELSQITKEDADLSGDTLILHFTGKGGARGHVSISRLEDEEFFEKLTLLIRQIRSGSKVFYSANYLQSHACKLGFQCHDLRRIYAKQQYAQTHSKQEVQKKLRHSRAKTTDIYLKGNFKQKGGL